MKNRNTQAEHEHALAIIAEFVAENEDADFVFDLLVSKGISQEVAVGIASDMCGFESL